MYQGVASTHFLFTQFEGMSNEEFDSAWLSLLCGQPGSVMAHSTSGQLMWVVANSEFCFLGWTLDVRIDPEGCRFFTNQFGVLTIVIHYSLSVNVYVSFY